jgi:DNA-binding PadR family transcriptional regulator
MSIRYAILGLLAEEPMHGYRLKKIFDRRVSPLWGLTTGQVYQTLAALERVALVESRSERRGRRPSRRVYSVTVSGRRDLAAWLAKSPARSRPLREEMLIRLMLFGESHSENLRRAIDEQIDDAAALMGRVRRLREQHCAARQRGLDVTGLFLESMSHLLEADVRNLELFRRQIECCGIADRRRVELDEIPRSTPSRQESPRPGTPFGVTVTLAAAGL